MPLPKLDDSQIAWIIKEVARYIETQRQSYRPGAVPLDWNERAAMQRSFGRPAWTRRAWQCFLTIVSRTRLSTENSSEWDLTLSLCQTSSA